MRSIVYLILLILGMTLSVRAQFSTQEFTPKPLPALPQMPAHIWLQAQEQSGFEAWPTELQTGFRLMNYARVYPKRFWDSVVSPIIRVYPFLKTKESASLQRDLEQTPSLPPFSINLTLQRLARSTPKIFGKIRSSRATPIQKGSVFLNASTWRAFKSVPPRISLLEVRLWPFPWFYCTST